MQESDVDVIISLSVGVTIAVTLTGVLQGADDDTLSHAGNVACGEVKALLGGEGEYGEALQGMEDGAVSEGHVLVLVAKTCVTKIAEYREVESLRKFDTLREFDTFREFATFRKAVSQ